MLNPHFSDELYLRFRNLLLHRCGLDYPESKRADLYHSLQLALRETGYADLKDLYTQVVTDDEIWHRLLAHVTIGETYFFRNTPQFNALREHILPEMFARRAAIGSLRLWSAGCATGEEPYSLAMTVCDLLPDHQRWHTSILATDINRDFLARAEAGVYGAWSFRETPLVQRERYFTPVGDRWQLRPEIRRMVRFLWLNLAEASYPAVTTGTCALDLILCRNVTIYFDAATTRQVVSRLYHALAPGGWLVVGHAEPQMGVYHQFEVHNFPDTIVYRKPLDAALFAFDAPSGTFSAGEAPVLPGAQAGAGTSPQSRPGPAESAPKLSRPAESGLPAAELTIPELVDQARQAADRGAWAAAEQQCADILQRDPLCRDAHYVLAQIYEHQGASDAALASYRRTVYLDRTFVPGMIGMAQVWHALGRTTEAQRAYRNALKQLALLPPTTVVSQADGVTYANLAALVTHQLQLLDSLVPAKNLSHK